MHLGELPAGQTPAHRGEEAGGHRRLDGGLSRQPLEHRRRVDDRLGVGHAEDGHIAAGGGGGRGRPQVLFVLAAGRAQMGVQIDEAGQQQPALACHDTHPGGRLEAVADLADAALADQHVDDLVETGQRVDGAGAADQQIGARAGPAPRAHRHAAPLSSVERSS